MAFRPNGGGGAPANLSLGAISATDLAINNSNGTGVTIPEASITEAGLLSATDKIKANLITTGGAGTLFLDDTGTYSAPTASAAWGGITGTLSAQTDLQTALDAKLNLSGGTMTGILAMGANDITGTGGHTATDFNGVALTTAGAATNFLNETGAYTALPTSIAQVVDSAGGQDVNTVGGAAVDWGLNQILDAGYTHTAGTSGITLVNAGVYKIAYNVSFITTSNARRQPRMTLRLDTVEAIASASYSYARNLTEDTATNSATTFVTATAGQVLDLFSIESGSSGATTTIANESWISIEFIR